MAVAKTARLVAAENIGPSARWLEFETSETAPVGFVGGQYIIVDSGITLPTGKIAKRAYSISSSDARQSRFEIVVRRIGDGAASNFLHALAVGAELRFSGPWGKFLPEGALGGGKTLIVATDTGITAGLGLLRGVAYEALLAQTTLLWLTPNADDFVPEAFVRERVPAGTGAVHRAAIPPVGHPERVVAGLGAFESILRQGAPERVYLAGDGALLYPFADALAAAGLPASQVVMECFFNNPARKVGISATGDAT